jgi:4-hydroxy-tetrahydrodipicolinate reductase
MIRLAIVGGAGRMGQVMAHGLGASGEFSVAALVDVHEPAEVAGALWHKFLDEVDPATVDAVVDFSTPEGVRSSAAWCGLNRKCLVVGTTGLTRDERDALAAAATTTGVVVASNFSVGAVLAARFAALAAPYFDRAEIVELHHDHKVDAPSGTSLTTAQAVADARRAAGRADLEDPTTRFTLESARGARGPGGVRIHSVRLAGLVAHQEVIFGAAGEGLTIRHDSYDRSSFVHGVALALRRVTPESGLVEGIDDLVV